MFVGIGQWDSWIISKSKVGLINSNKNELNSKIS